LVSERFFYLCLDVCALKLCAWLLFLLSLRDLLYSCTLDPLGINRLGRRSNTPYNHPQTGRHAPAVVGAAAAAADNRRSGNTWFSRIVDPASRLITDSAFRWFSSIFKKSPPAISSADEQVDLERIKRGVYSI